MEDKGFSTSYLRSGSGLYSARLGCVLSEMIVSSKGILWELFCCNLVACASVLTNAMTSVTLSMCLSMLEESQQVSCMIAQEPNVCCGRSQAHLKSS